eukprot:Skav224078  [mRNA]  locus=scaffold942:120530:128704:- [translate_table: standard]
MRSVASSIPTLSRRVVSWTPTSARCSLVMEPWDMVALWLIMLSTPPKDSANTQIFSRLKNLCMTSISSAS